MEQKNFLLDDCMDDIPPVVNASDPHMACLFLIDTSGSMGYANGEGGNAPISLLNDALNRFKDEVCEDSKTKEILDIAIIGFSNTTQVIQEFSPIEYMQKVNLEAKGGTVMVPAIRTALQMVDERSKFYRRLGTEPYKPWIVMISDGEPFDSVDEIAGEIQQLVEKGKLNFWSLSVPGANNEVLHKLSGRRVLNLSGYDFRGFFDWVNKSMRAVSVSAPGEKPKGAELPSTISIDDLM